MTAAEIDASLQLAREWRIAEITAAVNAALWLTQAASGAVPSGGAQILRIETPTKETT
jgi:hypothetical protein